MNSDCDFLVVIKNKANELQEASLRALHRDTPLRAGFWTKHLEGSYVLQSDLSNLNTLGKDWLYIDHGHKEM